MDPLIVQIKKALRETLRTPSSSELALAFQVILKWVYVDVGSVYGPKGALR